MKALHIETKGMHCPDCITRVEAALKRYDGVIGVTSDLSHERVSVLFDEASIGTDVIAAAVVAEGFDVVAL